MSDVFLKKEKKIEKEVNIERLTPQQECDRQRMCLEVKKKKKTDLKVQTEV